MIFGIGCDLCAISRMEKSLTGPHGPAFARRVFGPAERAALGLDGPGPLTPRRAASAAADFAAKEAFLKAAAPGWPGPLPWPRSRRCGWIPARRPTAFRGGRRTGWPSAALSPT